MRFEVSTSSGSGVGKAAFPKAFSDTVFADGLTTKSRVPAKLGVVMSDNDSLGGVRTAVGRNASGSQQHFLRRQFFHKESCDYR